MDKREVMRVLNRYAFACELLGRPQARAWSRAVWALRGVEGEFSELYHSGELAEIKGVGKGTLAVIGEVLAGQIPTSLTELEGELPEGLYAISQIKGLGPKKVRALWQELGVTTLGELEYACTENRLVELAGFGAKTQEKVLAEIARLASYEGLVRRDLAQALAIAIGEKCVDAEVAGELAMGAELVHEVVLVAATAPEGFAVVDGEARFEVEGVAVRVRVAPVGRGRALVEETSEPGHLAALRERGELVDAETEEEVYAALGLVATPRERRLDGVPLVERGKPAPELLRWEHLAGALHNHTVASDGAHTLEQMCQAAGELGLSWLGISEHSVSANYAGGLTEDALAAQVAAVREGTRPGATALIGVESDILEDGSLDYEDALLERLDYVVASVHRRYGQPPEVMTARVLAAARHPLVDVIGHPTGRLLLGRPSNGLDVAALVEACAESGCAVELNCSPHRLDVGLEGLALAKEAGVMVSVAADAHSTRALANLHHGLALARRAGLGPEHVLNSLDAEALRGWVGRRRARALGE
ncbi:MAG: hypothetical protein EP330_17470 [Deltaproteobacteria bacterium]|nr:MAG: hypothetical protein EP330_17470 [Deltaproteobacteria bacterium]